MQQPSQTSERSLEDRSSRQPISWSPTSAHTYDPVNASNDVDPVTNGAADGFVATYQQIRRGPLLSLKALLAFCKDCLCFPMARWDHGTRGTLARLRMMLEPAISADRVRIRFVCFCGKAVWEDYPKDLEPQARNLERRLDRHFREVESRAGEDRKPYGFRHFIGRVVSDLKYFSNWLNRKLSGEQRDSKVDAESQEPDTVSATVQEGPYYLTSFPSPGDRRPRLAQVAASEIQGDQAYFAMLRAKARAIQRRWINILVPRKVKAINYVRVSAQWLSHNLLLLTWIFFQMYLLHDNEHVDVFQSVEPQFPKDEDEYSPVETQLQEAESLYLGSNTLLHFFEKEHDCCAYPHALFAIPKKLRGKLSVPERGRPMIGWGMRLVDGIDTFRLGLNGFAGLLASSMVGIIWARLHHDVQGGSGISQCLILNIRLSLAWYFVTFVVSVSFLATSSSFVATCFSDSSIILFRSSSSPSSFFNR